MKRRIVSSIIVAVASYAVVLVIINLLYGRPVLTDINSSTFWMGLTFLVPVTVVIILARNLWPQRSLEYLLKVVPIALLVIGIAMIFLSRNESLWIDPSWNPSVLGSGVSVTALGMTLLTVFWPRQAATDNVKRPARVSHRDNRLTRNKTGTAIGSLFNRHMILFVGSIASLLLLIIFMILTYFFPTPMGLDIKWVLVSLIPILLALIGGGYIKIFRGFGIEIETRITEPVSLLDLDATEAYTILPDIKKRGLDALWRLSQRQRNRMARLTFTARRRRYYSPDVMHEHFNALPNLQYFEILDTDSKFICLLPVSLFKENEEVNTEKLHEFVRAVENDTVLNTYRRDAITLAVTLNQSVIEVLHMLRRRREEIAVVIDMNGLVLGIIKTTDIEKRIADEVLRAKKLF